MLKKITKDFLLVSIVALPALGITKAVFGEIPLPMAMAIGIASGVVAHIVDHGRI